MTPLFGIQNAGCVTVPSSSAEKLEVRSIEGTIILRPVLIVEFWVMRQHISI